LVSLDRRAKHKATLRVSPPGWLTITAVAFLLSGGAMSDPQLAGFHYSVLTDPESQWKVHELSYRDAKGPGRTVIARIVPAGGSNLVSLEVDGTEMLRTPPKISQAAGVGYGIPILYPTPNRVRDSRFMFDGRTFQFKPNERSNFIHGLVNRAEWKADPPVMRSDGVSLKTYIDFDQKSPNFSLFPILNRLTMTYALATDGILMGFAVENRDGRPLPFGFGLHPYFRILGDRGQTYLQVPAERHMEAEGLLPTGKLQSLEGAPFDLRQPTSLADLKLDDVYWGMVPERPAGYEFRDRGIRVTLEASELFTHAVVYTPQGRPYFCIENQTCSTDAHNLHGQGFEREAHLIVLKPGESATGSVRIRVGKL